MVFTATDIHEAYSHHQLVFVATPKVALQTEIQIL